MRRFTFTDEELQAISRDRFHHPDPHVQQRMEILWLKAQGETHERSAVLASVSRRTVQRLLDLFWDGRLEAVRKFAWHGPTSVLAEHRPTLEEAFREQPPHTVSEACERIEQLTGVRRKETQVRQFLRQSLGLRWRKVSAIPVPPKMSVDEQVARQAAFLQTELEPKLVQARAGERSVFFVDAAHFVRGSFLGCVWCVARLCVRAASGRQRYNVLGALNACTRELVAVTNHTYITAETVCELLRKIAALGLTTPITLVLDNASYQRCALVQNLAAELGIELLFLPSYSPNLNLIERLWKFVKKKALNSRRHANYAKFHAAIDDCLARLTTDYHLELSTLITHNFQTFKNVPILAA
jgi:transposase